MLALQGQGLCLIWSPQHLTTGSATYEVLMNVSAVLQDFPSILLSVFIARGLWYPDILSSVRKQETKIPQQRGNPGALSFILGHNCPTSK